MAQPGQARTSTMRAQIELRERVLNGDLAGGTRLYEVSLADDLGISRTPVRAALSSLAEEGLLERASGGGFRVRRFDYKDALDAIELRGVLEGVAARMAAERRLDEAELSGLAGLAADLDGCFDTAGGAVDFDSYAELNLDYHNALTALADSPILKAEIDRVTKLPFASPSAFLVQRAESVDVFRELLVSQSQHHALLEAIAEGSGARAEAVAREHTRSARKNLLRQFAQGQEASPLSPDLALVVR